jgi:hypothetical protein
MRFRIVGIAWFPECFVGLERWLGMRGRGKSIKDCRYNRFDGVAWQVLNRRGKTGHRRDCDAGAWQGLKPNSFILSGLSARLK